MSQPKHPANMELLATKGQRITNAIIDGIIVSIIYYALFFIAGMIFLSGGNATPSAASGMILVTYLIYFISFFGYYVATETFMKGKTIGKLVSKTTTLNNDGTQLTMGQSFIRTLCRLIPFEAFSFLGADTYGWHDSISKTMVVDDALVAVEGLNNIDSIGVEVTIEEKTTL